MLIEHSKNFPGQFRECDWHIAKRLEMFILWGDDDVCSEELMSASVRECLGDRGVQILRKVINNDGDDCRPPKRKRPIKSRQCDVGCHDHFHKVSRNTTNFIPDFAPVPECRRKKSTGRLAPQVNVATTMAAENCGCTRADTVCVSDYVAVPSVDRWGSVSGTRTWVRISPGLLDSYIESVARG